MRIKHIWSVLCRESIISNDDNVISLIGVLEELTYVITPKDSKLLRPEKINIPFNFEIINYWVKESTDEVKMKIKTAIIDPEGKEINNVVNESVFPEGVKKLRSRLKVQGLAVTRNGEYTLRISVRTDEEDYKVVSELPLSVTVQVKKESIPVKA